MIIETNRFINRVISDFHYLWFSCQRNKLSYKLQEVSSIETFGMTNGKLFLKGKLSIYAEKYAGCINEANFHGKTDNRRRIDYYGHRNEQNRKLNFGSQQVAAAI